MEPKTKQYLSLIHISEPTRRTPISYAVFCLKKKKNLIPISEPTKHAEISYAGYCLKKKTNNLDSKQRMERNHAS